MIVFKQISSGGSGLHAIAGSILREQIIEQIFLSHTKILSSVVKLDFLLRPNIDKECETLVPFILTISFSLILSSDLKEIV